MLRCNFSGFAGSCNGKQKENRKRLVRLLSSVSERLLPDDSSSLNRPWPWRLSFFIYALCTFSLMIFMEEEEEEAVRRIPHGEGDTLCTRSLGWKELRLNNNNQDGTYIFFFCMCVGVSFKINSVKMRKRKTKCCVSNTEWISSRGPEAWLSPEAFVTWAKTAGNEWTPHNLPPRSVQTAKYKAHIIKKK